MAVSSQILKAARPCVDTGKVQLRRVVVAILGPTSPGKAVALLAAKDPAPPAHHEQQHAKGGTQPLGQVQANIRAQLDANQKRCCFGYAHDFYKDASGKLQTMQGAPSAEMLVKIMVRVRRSAGQ